MERDQLDYVKSRDVKRIPGYGGHCPIVNSLHGFTYGNATKIAFLLGEQQNMKTSKISSLRRCQSEPHKTLVEYLLKPAVTIPFRPVSAKNHSQLELPYSLTHTGKRRDEIFSFHESSQHHRDYYQDLTGTVHEVPSFSKRKLHQLPSFSRRRHHTAPATRTTGIIQEGNIPISLRQPPQAKLTSHMYITKIPHYELKYQKYQDRQPSTREKERRDVYFERR